MQCPVCLTVELRITERAGVEIDYCPKCRGIWLDRGELEKIIERAERDLPYIEPPPKAKRGANVPDVLDLEHDFADRRYDDDDHRPERFQREEGRPHSRRKGFLSELFDIFD
ncbi:MAG: zf-TFIIB domain-containing protein [Aggregatilineales bacterium]